MATIERRNDKFRVIFYHLGKRYSAALKATDSDEADRTAARVEDSLSLIRDWVSESHRAAAAGDLCVRRPDGDDFRCDPSCAR
jgi:hypothetical protein